MQTARTTPAEGTGTATKPAARPNPPGATTPRPDKATNCPLCHEELELLGADLDTPRQDWLISSGPSAK